MSAPPELDYALLHALFRFNASLGTYRFIKGIDYVRCIELPFVAREVLRDVRASGSAYLDVGCGDSILPSFVATHSAATVTVVDKVPTVWAQAGYLRRLGRAEWLSSGRVVVHQSDLLTCALGESRFDVVTAVSVLEHLDGDGDSEAVRRVYRWLRPGGRLLLSAPYNHERPATYFVPYPVYGAQPGACGAFFQRHYSGESLRRRVLDAAPFVVEQLFYASHDGTNLYKRLWLVPQWLKPVKAFYNWAAPFYAPRFLRATDQPPSDPMPHMLTADTVFAYLRKSA